MEKGSSRFLQEDNCPTYHAEGDADVLIVKAAVESARERNTVLVGDDTDLARAKGKLQKTSLEHEESKRAVR